MSESPPIPFSTPSISVTMPSKSAVASGWKTIPALPELLRLIEVAIVTSAVLMANSRSGAGCLSARRPVRMSKMPTRR